MPYGLELGENLHISGSGANWPGAPRYCVSLFVNDWELKRMMREDLTILWNKSRNNHWLEFPRAFREYVQKIVERKIRLGIVALPDVGHIYNPKGGVLQEAGVIK